MVFRRLETVFEEYATNISALEEGCLEVFKTGELKNNPDVGVRYVNGIIQSAGAVGTSIGREYESIEFYNLGENPQLPTRISRIGNDYQIQKREKNKNINREATRIYRTLKPRMESFLEMISSLSRKLKLNAHLLSSYK